MAALLGLVDQCDNFPPGTEKDYVSLQVDGCTVGWITPIVVNELFPQSSATPQQVFVMEQGIVKFSPLLEEGGMEKRSQALNGLLKEWYKEGRLKSLSSIITFMTG